MYKNHSVCNEMGICRECETNEYTYMFTDLRYNSTRFICRKCRREGE